MTTNKILIEITDKEIQNSKDFLVDLMFNDSELTETDLYMLSSGIQEINEMRVYNNEI